MGQVNDTREGIIGSRGFDVKGREVLVQHFAVEVAAGMQQKRRRGSEV